MAEEKVKETNKETEPVKEKVVEKVEKPVVEDLGIDKEAIAEIMRSQGERDAKRDEEMKTLKKDVGETAKGAQEKLDKISQVFTGETKEAKADKIFREFAEDPEATLQKYGEGKSNAELAEIKGILEEMKFEKADNTAMRNISTADPDYEVVTKNIGSMTTEEERKKYEGDANRFEILYGLTKSRMAGKIAESKLSAEGIKTNAINESNKSAVSEKPGGKGAEELTEAEETRRRIEKKRDEFDVDGVLDEVMDGDWEMIYKKRINR